MSVLLPFQSTGLQCCHPLTATAPNQLTSLPNLSHQRRPLLNTMYAMLSVYGGHRPQPEVWPSPHCPLPQTKFFLSITEHLGWKIIDYILVLCQKYCALLWVQYIGLYIHRPTNLYSAKIVTRIWGDECQHLNIYGRQIFPTTAPLRFWDSAPIAPNMEVLEPPLRWCCWPTHSSHSKSVLYHAAWAVTQSGSCPSVCLSALIDDRFSDSCLDQVAAETSILTCHVCSLSSSEYTPDIRPVARFSVPVSHDTIFN